MNACTGGIPFTDNYGLVFVLADLEEMSGLVGTSFEFLGPIRCDELQAVDGFRYVLNRDKQGVLEGFQPIGVDTFKLEVRIFICGVFSLAPGIGTPCPAFGLYSLPFLFALPLHGLQFGRISDFLCRGHCLVCLAAPCFRNSTFPTAKIPCCRVVGMEHIPSVIASRSISCDGKAVKGAICYDLRWWFYASILHGLLKRVDEVNHGRPL